MPRRPIHAAQVRQRPGEPTLAQVIRDALTSRLRDVHTAIPGRVQKYDPATQTADVQPVVNGVIFSDDGEQVLEALPVLPNVPIAWPRGGGGSLQFPLLPGDHVLLVFSEAATALWRTTGQISQPGDLVRHDLSYAFGIPGVSPDASPLSPPLGPDETRLDGTSTIRVGGVAAGPVSLDALVATELAKITLWAGAVTTALGALGQTVAPLAPFAPTGTTKLKAE